MNNPVSNRSSDLTTGLLVQQCMVNVVIKDGSTKYLDRDVLHEMADYKQVRQQTNHCG